MKETFVLIMAGGVGSRFWPASREDHPKQFLDILGTGRSLIQMTFDRFHKWVPAENIYVITNERYRGLVSQHLPELTQEQIVGEPSRNNTAPCVAYASMKLYKKNPDAVCIVAPADHIIMKEDQFLHLVAKASDFAHREDALVTLGITPTRPDTGYGYIDFISSEEPEQGVFKVKQFKEKPIREVAQQYLDEGHYLWNSGMFIWSLREILNSFQKHASGIYELLFAGMDHYNTENEEAFVSEHYPKTESISIDYAILERAANVHTLPAEIGWSDLGTWVSLFQKVSENEKDNVVLGEHTIIEDCAGCVIKSLDGKLLVVKGLEDYIIISDEKSVLIFPKEAEQEIKQITSKCEQMVGRNIYK